MKMSIAVIGPSSFVTCFQLIGARGYEANDEETVVATLNSIAHDDYKIIIVPEQYTQATRPIREEVMKFRVITRTHHGDRDEDGRTTGRGLTGNRDQIGVIIKWKCRKFSA